MLKYYFDLISELLCYLHALTIPFDGVWGNVTWLHPRFPHWFLYLVLLWAFPPVLRKNTFPRGAAVQTLFFTQKDWLQRMSLLNDGLILCTSREGFYHVASTVCLLSRKSVVKERKSAKNQWHGNRLCSLLRLQQYAAYGRLTPSYWRPLSPLCILSESDGNKVKEL